MEREPTRTVNVTVRQAAEILGLAPETVRERIHREELPAFKKSGRWIVSLPVSDRNKAPVGPEDTSTGSDDLPSPPTPTSIHLSQLNVIRDELLQPMIKRIEELAYENGQAHAEIRFLAEQRDELATGCKPQQQPPRRFWRR